MCSAQTSHSKKKKWGIEPESWDPKATILPLDQRGTVVFWTVYSDICITKPGHVIMNKEAVSENLVEF